MKNKKTLEQIISETKYKDIDLPLPPPIILIDDKCILTDSNYITISGLPKSRKTTFMQMFIASALTDSTFHTIKVKLDKKDKICLIDTEQSVYDFQRQNKFLKQMIRKNKLPNNFSAYLFREYEPETILKAIVEICEKEKPKLFFLDNLTELVINPNDLIEAKAVTQFLKRITAKYNCSIVCLLHLNKSNGFTLGNLGSYADRGAQSVLKVSVDKETDISTLECTMLRSDAHFEPISISFDPTTNTYTQTSHPTQAAAEKKKKFSMSNYTKNEIVERINIIYQNTNTYTYTPLVEELRKIFGVGNNSIKQVIIPYLIGNKFLYSNAGIYTITKQ